MKSVTSVTSADGPVIAYEQQGSSPALIIADGALSTRSGKAALRSLLAAQLTVLGYDRRGRGDSGDTLPYAVDREIEDIQALIEVAGGTAALYQVGGQPRDDDQIGPLADHLIGNAKAPRPGVARLGFHVSVILALPARQRDR